MKMAACKHGDVCRAWMRRTGIAPLSMSCPNGCIHFERREEGTSADYSYEIMMCAAKLLDISCELGPSMERDAVVKVYRELKMIEREMRMHDDE